MQLAEHEPYFSQEGAKNRRRHKAIRAAERNRGAERLVDGGKQCTVLPALKNVSGLLNIEQLREENNRRFDEKRREEAKERRKQKLLMERMHRGNPSGDRALSPTGRRSTEPEDDRPSDAAEEVRRILLPPILGDQRRAECFPDVSSSPASSSSPSSRHPLGISQQAKRLQDPDHCSPRPPCERQMNHHDVFDAQFEAVMPREAGWGHPKPTRGRIQKEKVRNRYTYLPVGKLDSVKEGNAVESATQSSSPSTQKRRSTTRGSVVSQQVSDQGHIPLPQAIGAGRHLGLLRRQACEGLRLLVFGAVGHEDATDEKTRIARLCEGSGTKEEVVRLFTECWHNLDNGNDTRGTRRSLSRKNAKNLAIICNGSVTIDDYQCFLLEKYPSKAQRVQVDKVLSGLLDHPKDSVTFHELLRTFSLAHLLRLAWPGSSSKQLQQMLGFVDELLEYDKCHIAAPPVLSIEDYKALWATFHYLNKQGDGRGVRFATLIKNLLCDADDAERYGSDFGLDRHDEISLGVFLMMMCPAGFRAFKDAVVGTNEKGEWLTLSRGGMWQLAVPPKSAPGLRDVEPDDPSKVEINLADLEVELLS